jgi:hypothetical protein
VKRLLLIIPLLVIAGCQTVNTAYRVHKDFRPQEANLPKKLLILPTDISVHEIAAGGVVDKVEDWSREARQHAKNAIQAHFQKRNDVQLIELPVLSKDDQFKLEQYQALYFAVAHSALIHTHGIHEWPHKRQFFDYSLGNGLRFLREKTGADAAIFVIGEDFVASSSYRAQLVVAALFGVVIPAGHSLLSAGIVDLHSGDVLWLDHALNFGGRDLRKAEDVDQMMAQMLRNYPGVSPTTGQKIAKQQ